MSPLIIIAIVIVLLGVVLTSYTVHKSRLETLEELPGEETLFVDEGPASFFFYPRPKGNRGREYIARFGYVKVTNKRIILATRVPWHKGRHLIRAIFCYAEPGPVLTQERVLSFAKHGYPTYYISRDEIVFTRYKEWPLIKDQEALQLTVSFPNHGLFLVPEVLIFSPHLNRYKEVFHYA